MSNTISTNQIITVLKSWDRNTLLEVLSNAFGLSKSRAKQMIDSRNVFVNNKRIWIAKYQVRTGDKIHVANIVNKSPIKPEPKLDILFEDQWILVVNKPAGVLSNGPRSLEEDLQKSRKTKAIRVAHRLDRDTSGVIIATKNNEVFERIKDIFSEHKVIKTYSALVVGYGSRPLKFSIDTPIDGKSALSLVEFKKNYGKVSLLEIQIITGRTHQIRKHLSSLQIAILGDKEYFNKQSNSLEFRNTNRQMLHASQIQFDHPYTNLKLSVKAKLPSDFDVTLKVLNLVGK